MSAILAAARTEVGFPVVIYTDAQDRPLPRYYLAETDWGGWAVLDRVHPAICSAWDSRNSAVNALVRLSCGIPTNYRLLWSPRSIHGL